MSNGGEQAPNGGEQAPNGGQQAPIGLFYSYSHRDEGLALKLKDHLTYLRQNGMIAVWYDRDIGLGEEWEKEIDLRLWWATSSSCW